MRSVTLLGGCNGGVLGPLDGRTVAAQPASQVLGQECRTGADANANEDCRIVADIDSIQSYWGATVRGYTIATTVFFTGSTSTGCGQASTHVGPFYWIGNDRQGRNSALSAAASVGDDRIQSERRGRSTRRRGRTAPPRSASSG